MCSCILCLFQGGKFHLASQGLREEVERVSRELHKWEPYNIDQLVRREERRREGREGGREEGGREGGGRGEGERGGGLTLNSAVVLQLDISHVIFCMHSWEAQSMRDGSLDDWCKCSSIVYCSY